MDIMHQNTATGISVILSALELLQSIYNSYPGNTGVSILCMTKSMEFVNVFSGAEIEQKQKVVNILRRIDPSNSEKYDKITK
jgi:hypothetical protein